MSGVSFEDIKTMVSDHVIETKFQIGDEIVVPWINPADNKEYDMPFIVAHFSENFKDDTGASRYGVGFVSKYSLPTTYVFSQSNVSKWSVSNIRQWLNKRGYDWWEPQFDGDTVPNVYKEYKGFLDTLPSDMVDFISPIKVSVQEYGGTVDNTFDKFFLLSTYEMNISNSANTSNLAKNGIEGEPWQYYRNMNNNVLYTNTKAVASRKVYNIVDKTSAVSCWLRSACLGDADSVWCLYSTGSLNYYYTGYMGVAPAFVIY